MTEGLTKYSGGTRRRGQILLEMEYIRRGFIRLAIFDLNLEKRMETSRAGKGLEGA